MDIGQGGKTEILASIPPVCGRSRGCVSGETSKGKLCAAGLAAA
jgi:hypothetical protein